MEADHGSNEDAPYVASAAFFLREIFGVTIKPDQDPSSTKPRREPRFPVDTRVVLIHAGKSISGQAIELSQSGIAIVTVADLALGEVVDLYFTLGRNLMRLRAIVRNRKGARYGIEFLTLSSEQRRQIVTAYQALR